MLPIRSVAIQQTHFWPSNQPIPELCALELRVKAFGGVF